jgi:hypothetical protein
MMSSPFEAISQLHERGRRVLRDRGRLAGREVGHVHRHALGAAQRIEQIELVGLLCPLDRGEAAHAVHHHRRLDRVDLHVRFGLDLEDVRVVAREDRIARRRIRIQDVPRLVARRGVERIPAHTTFVDPDHRDLP